jgi:thiosulfate/3-mercaptopyruvate sulfurtransferase
MGLVYYWQPMLKLISIDEFENAVRQDEVDVLLDARPVDEFDDGHIPGARHIAWEDWNEAAPDWASAELHQPGYWGRLADPLVVQAAERLTAMGISNTSHIVIYADGMRSKGREGRIAWMLLYFGARNVSILNGGWRGWKNSVSGRTSKSLGDFSCGPYEAILERVRKHPFQLQLDERRRAALPDIHNAIQHGQVIDTRGTREFAGLLYEYQPRLGHIPGAVNVPYRSLLHANGRFIEPDEYVSLVIEKGITPRPVWYCEVGVRAAMMSLLHELYTGEVTPVYDASFMEWALDEKLPVECNLSLSI